MNKKGIFLVVALLILVLVLAGLLLRDYVSISIAGRSEDEMEEEEVDSNNGYASANIPGTTAPPTTTTTTITPPTTTVATTKAITTLTTTGSESPLPPPGGGSWGVGFSFTFNPQIGPTGTEVKLFLSESRDVMVYYIEPAAGRERVLPKKVYDGGTTLTVTVPADAKNGYFELRWDGGKVRADEIFTVMLQAQIVMTTFTFSPTSGPPGSDVNLYLNEPKNVMVAFKGSVLPKKTSADGKTLTVTIPAGATSGYFEILWDGGRFQNPVIFTVTP